MQVRDLLLQLAEAKSLEDEVAFYAYKGETYNGLPLLTKCAFSECPEIQDGKFGFCESSTEGDSDVWDLAMISEWLLGCKNGTMQQIEAEIKRLQNPWTPIDLCPKAENKEYLLLEGSRPEIGRWVETEEGGYWQKRFMYTCYPTFYKEID